MYNTKEQKFWADTMLKLSNQKGLDKVIWEGRTVKDFIFDLAPSVKLIMEGGSWKKPFKNKAELASWCTDNQPNYKKKIPAVVNYFAKLYEIK